jgi:hypothetical protein
MASKDLAIGILSVTATILFCTLLVVNLVSPQPAMGYGQNATGGEYLVATSQLNEGVELLCIFDTGAERMNIYVFNPQVGQIEMLQPPIPLQRNMRNGQPNTN